MNNWPNPDKPGVPLNPEKDGWHFVERQKEITAIEWISGEWWTGGLGTYGGGYYNSEYIGLNYTYLGPCLMPSEVAAQVEQARREGAKAMREACVEQHTDNAARYASAGLLDDSRHHHLWAVLMAALPLPGDDE